MKNRISHICNALSVDLDGDRLVAIYRALRNACPIVKKLPPPVFEMDQGDRWAHLFGTLIQDDYYSRDPDLQKTRFGENPNANESTLFMVDHSVSLMEMDILARKTPKILVFGFYKREPAPAGRNVLHKEMHMGVLNGRRLVCVRKFEIFPELKVLWRNSDKDWIHLM